MQNGHATSHANFVSGHLQCDSWDWRCLCIFIFSCAQKRQVALSRRVNQWKRASERVTFCYCAWKRAFLALCVCPWERERERERERSGHCWINQISFVKQESKLCPPLSVSGHEKHVSRYCYAIIYLGNYHKLIQNLRLFDLVRSLSNIYYTKVSLRCSLFVLYDKIQGSCSPMVREIGVQFLVASYQGLNKWYLISPCLTLSIIR